ncbi:MAG TPA: SPFH domain-containing protein [Bacteroidota bacterium]|nr:SPFH domain-containing protein [Bacteroidota bacterium]
MVTWLIVIVVLALAAGLIFWMTRQYRKAGPNEVLVISGRRSVITTPDGTKQEIGYKFRIGGGSFVNPFKEQADTLPIEVVSVNIRTPEVLSKDGIPILSESSAQVKIDSNEYSIFLATQNFMGGGTDAVREVAQTVLEGKVRESIGSMTIEELYQNRQEFANRVYNAVVRDLGSMGLVMISFALKDITDTQGYLEALSKPRIAAAKRDAIVKQAEYDRDAEIYAAQAKKEADIAKLTAAAEVAGRNWRNEELKAKSQIEVNKVRAVADTSYELERYKLAQEVKREEYKVKFIETEEQAKVQVEEIKRKEKELEANVIKPAEARKAQIQTEAEAESYRMLREAEAKAQVRAKENELEAERIKMLGRSEADAMMEKAKAYGEYNQTAMYQMILDILPELTKNVAEPLSRIDKITLIGGTDGKLGTSQITGQIAEVLANVPEVVKTLTGVDLAQYLREKLGGNA